MGCRHNETAVLTRLDEDTIGHAARRQLVALISHHNTQRTPEPSSSVQQRLAAITAAAAAATAVAAAATAVAAAAATAAAACGCCPPVYVCHPRCFSFHTAAALTVKCFFLFRTNVRTLLCAPWQSSTIGFARLRFTCYLHLFSPPWASAREAAGGRQPAAA